MIKDAFLKGFIKAAMMPPMQMVDPQMQLIQQQLRLMPMQKQQKFERQLAGQFGMKGQSFLMNPSAYIH